MTTSTRKYANLDAFHAAFRAVVLAHIPTLPPGEWERLRELSEGANRPPMPKGSPEFAVDAPAAVLFDGALCEASTSVEDVLSTGLGKSAVQIGEIEGAPVWYIKSAGIYLWGPAPTGEFTLQFDITYPAYPPGW